MFADSHGQNMKHATSVSQCACRVTVLYQHVHVTLYSLKFISFFYFQFCGVKRLIIFQFLQETFNHSSAYAVLVKTFNHSSVFCEGQTFKFSRSNSFGVGGAFDRRNGGVNCSKKTRIMPSPHLCARAPPLKKTAVFCNAVLAC